MTPKSPLLPVKTKTNKQTEGGGSRIPVILNAIAAFIALAGLADATYLAVLALTGETAACG